MGEPLKPCPCCGGAAETDQSQSYRDIVHGVLGTAAVIYCRECALTISHCYEDVPFEDREDVMSMALDQWNNRVSDPRIAQLEGLLREARTKLERSCAVNLLVRINEALSNDH